MSKIALFILIVIIWVAFWGLITLLIDDILVRWFPEFNPLALRFIAYSVLAIVGLFIVYASDNVDSLI